MALLDGACNLFGTPLTDDVKARVIRYLDGPTEHGWNDIHGIVIQPRGRVRTIWQAVIAVDPTFPTTGPVVQLGKKIRGWTRIPNALLLARAVRFAIATS